MNNSLSWADLAQPIDKRRSYLCPGDKEQTVKFSVEHFIAIAEESIADHDYFAVALSGGSTPKSIFEELAGLAPNLTHIAWDKFFVFWSDERAVAPNDAESNYHMAMTAGWHALPVPAKQIFRMKAESDIENNAIAYEKLILSKIPAGRFDLIMLGMGDDGHTASLFPHTAGLTVSDKLVIANYIPQKECWRMTFTFSCINQARYPIFYVMGESKQAMIQKVFENTNDFTQYPSQKVGTPNQKAYWILDNKAAKLLQKA